VSLHSRHAKNTKNDSATKDTQDTKQGRKDPGGEATGGSTPRRVAARQVHAGRMNEPRRSTSSFTRPVWA
jgi:hypothetical protein